MLWDLDRVVKNAINARSALFEKWEAEGTDCYRVFHGAVEGYPGITIDRYGPNLLFQTFRDPVLLNQDADITLITNLVSETVKADLCPVLSHRGTWRKASSRHVVYSNKTTIDSPSAPGVVGRELGIRLDVRPRPGKDPLLHLDFRCARRWVLSQTGGWMEGKDVLNLFCFSGAIGIAAAKAGAKTVWNIDFSKSALETCRHNAALNGVQESARFRVLRTDAIPTVRQLAGLPVKGRGERGARMLSQTMKVASKLKARGIKKIPLPKGLLLLEPRLFDLVILDPPTFSSSHFGAVDIVRDYQSLFKPAVLCTRPDGGRVLATNHVSVMGLEEWIQALRRCAEKAGRPVRDIEVLKPEEDFPAMEDGKYPLKVVVVHL